MWLWYNMAFIKSIKCVWELPHLTFRVFSPDCWSFHHRQCQTLWMPPWNGTIYEFIHPKNLLWNLKFSNLFDSKMPLWIGMINYCDDYHHFIVVFILSWFELIIIQVNIWHTFLTEFSLIVISGSFVFYHLIINFLFKQFVSSAYLLYKINILSTPIQRTHLTQIALKVSHHFSSWIFVNFSAIWEKFHTQLFEMASWRNIQSHFWAFNIQCNIGSKLDHLTTIFFLKTFVHGNDWKFLRW